MVGASSYLIYLIYAAPLLGLFVWAARRRSRLEAVSTDTYEDALESGLTQPPSLHPLIDHGKCIGCESCVHACPEFPAHQVLGIIDGKAQLVGPTDCIGHGLCQRVCPTGAISLVFGTSERGVDIPAVNGDFSTNIDGIYIAGELGGMGLIRNAIEQGRQAIEAIAERLEPGRRQKRDEDLDVLIVGAGPAGIAATLGAMERNLRHRTVEQHVLGGTVANFPRGKIVMTAPADLPLVGKLNLRETTKEKLITLWQRIRSETGMVVSYGERLLGIEPTGSGLRVTTTSDTYNARAVLLAIGRRGTPRKLGVPGEDLPKVSYTLLDPEDHRGRSVLVVGGGDSALEAACSIAETTDATVTLSYRSEAFSRARQKNRKRVEGLAASRRLRVLLGSNVLVIREHDVLIEHGGKQEQLQNGAVIICAGGILPDALLREIGIGIETKYGTS